MIETVIVAHQGGWDEVLLVLIPIAIIAVALRIANQRASAIRDAGPESDSDG